MDPEHLTATAENPSGTSFRGNQLQTGGYGKRTFPTNYPRESVSLGLTFLSGWIAQAHNGMVFNPAYIKQSLIKYTD